MKPFSQDMSDQGRLAHITHAEMSEPTHLIQSHQTTASAKSLSRRVSAESIRTEFCEGPVDNPYSPTTPERKLTGALIYDRAELIHRLKMKESPIWVPGCHSRLYEDEVQPSQQIPQTSSLNGACLLPPPAIAHEKRDGKQGLSDVNAAGQLESGLGIERPRSALHSGDFTPDDQNADARERRDATHLRESHDFRHFEDSWTSRDPTSLPFSRQAMGYRKEAFGSPSSSLSSSLSTSFAYKHPTSPLVHTESREDIELETSSDGISSVSPNMRRHTINWAHGSSLGHGGMLRHTPPHRERALPYQAHQPRRSLASLSGLSIPSSSPQTLSIFRSRRLSHSSEGSPLQHASMVGSYEESILRGRMSTTPSKPLEFMAQIGVLGLGKCKPNLRCPSHVTLPFSAVFYRYSSTVHGRNKGEDGPSPYVGQIDLENGLPNPEELQRSKRKQQSRFAGRTSPDDDRLTHNIGGEVSGGDSQRLEKNKKTSRSPKAPPGGSYRIPEKGQLQIIIKNQNKTAVKLFLVPYDLTGMEAGTKTFIRQRSYSAGPIIDGIKSTVPDGPPILRYLIHLHICSPSSGRFYLYKDIRVVFANRVPDGTEKLRNEVTYPEPRYMPYKALRTCHLSSTPTNNFVAPKPSQNAPSLAAGSQHENQSHMCQPSQDMGYLNTCLRLPRPTAITAGGDAMTGLELTGPPALLGRYDKLNRGDVGYGGNPFGHVKNGRPGSAESLLSKRLRSLGVQSLVADDAAEDGVNGPVSTLKERLENRNRDGP
ncbi:unnamed protein product [Sordaria macrospora k-hell]|uniref:WGS project CABT00000000 data, contig 2.2 n=1 Tax=Sordaria macrospora (strain ATCC MYA-333 / DSM 997 / K(L3346) / K-hell) TaxID=771870 RepID=F7VNA7_SORMK|nr:uncharacterized protein SMAC_12094 [Sordaria macrospora k-hell]CCC06836.1 unnamed protein product [Sordaria macrospora k-hell]